MRPILFAAILVSLGAPALTAAAPRPVPVVVDARVLEHHFDLLLRRAEAIQSASATHRPPHQRREFMLQQATEIEGIVRQLKVLLRNAPAALPPPPVAPPPPPQPEAPPVVSEAAFAALQTSLADEPSGDVKMRQLQLALRDRAVTCDQVRAILDSFAFSSEKIAALKFLAGRIADRTNSYRILDAFVHSSDKTAAADILEGR